MSHIIYKEPVSEVIHKTDISRIISQRMRDTLVKQKEKTSESAKAGDTAAESYLEVKRRTARIGMRRSQVINKYLAENRPSSPEIIRPKRNTGERLRANGTPIKTRYYANTLSKRSSNVVARKNNLNASVPPDTSNRPHEQGKQLAIRQLTEGKRIGSFLPKVGSSVTKIVRMLIQKTRSINTGITVCVTVAVAIVTMMGMIGTVAASPFGLFFSIEDTSGENIKTVIWQLSKEFYDRIEIIRSSTPYDVLDLKSDNGSYGVMWEGILPVYAVMTSTNGKDTVTIDEEKTSVLRTMMNDLTKLTYEVTEEEIPSEEDKESQNEDESEETEPETIRTLHIYVQHKDISEYISDLNLSVEQKQLLAEISSPKYAPLWAKVMGGYSPGGQIIPSSATWIPTGIFSWPLPINGTITSGFGYRTDPFTREQKFHGGIDIAVGEGTPILAAADGTVVVGNASDPWGGGYGYYVVIDHGNGYTTLYGHCSSVCVIPGQAVYIGEVIAYVGSTGNSTGNHLHFEILCCANRIDPWSFYK